MKKEDGPRKEKRGTVLEEKNGDDPGKEKKRDGPGRKKKRDGPGNKNQGPSLLFYKISLHILVDGNAKNVIFCRTKNAWKRSKIGSFVDYYNFICYPKYSIYIKQQASK